MYPFLSLRVSWHPLDGGGTDQPCINPCCMYDSFPPSVSLVVGNFCFNYSRLRSSIQWMGFFRSSIACACSKRRENVLAPLFPLRLPLAMLIHNEAKVTRRCTISNIDAYWFQINTKWICWLLVPCYAQLSRRRGTP